MLGAVFTIWQFDTSYCEVLVLGFEMDQPVSTLCGVQPYLLLEPDPSLPRTIWATDALLQIKGYANDAKNEAFKYQALPEYEQDECGSVYDDSLQAWKMGKLSRARALLQDDPNRILA